MSKLSVEFQIVGKGSASLPVEIVTPNPAQIEGLDSVEVTFRVENILSRDVTIDELTVTKEGPSAEKATGTLLDDTMTIAAGSKLENTLTVEATEPWTEADRATFKVEGAEA